MRLLIIEDDNNKRERIANEIRETWAVIDADQAGIVITEARSYQSGLRNVMSDQYDFVLLDMSLPVYDISHEEDGLRVDPFSGRDILAEMDRKNVLIPTIVITMFETFGEGSEVMTLEELDRELSTQYSRIYKGSIYYSSSEVNWKASLKDLLVKKND